MSRRQRHKWPRMCFEFVELRYCLSAIAFVPHNIECCSGVKPWDIYAADLDGNGTVDVLSALEEDGVAWYENTNGRGDFGQRQIITTEVNWGRSVSAADLDGDGDLDVLSGSYREIAWHENTDGHGAFGDRQIAASSGGDQRVVAADLDGDGDLDILARSITIFADFINWYENTDGQGTLGDRQNIDRVFGSGAVHAADVDGDGDLDIVSASAKYDTIAWYENTGEQDTFGNKQIITAGPGTGEIVMRPHVSVADLDGDGDMDVLSASGIDATIAWYENTDGQATWDGPEVITAEAEQVTLVHAADLDGDGDVDVLSASRHDATIAWYENIDGKGTFSQQQIIITSADGTWDVHAADIDSDGDVDVLSASVHDGKITWHENRLLGDVNDDGVFTANDLVQVFQSGKYEDSIPNNATFDEGDWNQDGEFDSSDMVLAFQAGHYEHETQPTASEVAAAVDWLFAQDQRDTRQRAFVA